MANQIDISKIEDNELKAMVYDRIKVVQIVQAEIQAIEQELARRQQKPGKPEKEPKKEN